MEPDRLLQAIVPADRWPARVRTLAARWRQPMETGAREADLAEMWRLLNLALHRAVRCQAATRGSIVAADVADIAADKALDLVGMLDDSRWEPANSTDAQIAAFLAAVARHGVIDRLRSRRREAIATAAPGGPARAGLQEEARAGADLELSVDGDRYARAIVACASRLTARARRAWVLRVFCDFTAAEIAAHPEVRTTTGGADLILNRSRRQIRKCMASKGFEPGRIPPGTFASLWELVTNGAGAPATAPREGEA